MKIRIFKKHWDSSQKQRAKELKDGKEFDALVHCMLATAVRAKFPEGNIEKVTFSSFTLDGQRYYAKDSVGTSALVHHWCYHRPEGRASLPQTIEFEPVSW